MKVRRIQNGDYCLGHGDSEFLTNTPEAVAQNVATRLALFRGSWLINTDAGMPWSQEILGKHEAADAVISAYIAATDGVVRIEEFESILNSDERSISITATIETIYGTAELRETIA